ncbi:hypothetical protein AWB64_03428 [Caballeronia sordidicola]|uniref:DUF305 domain-containing protein n=2 Tax=Caballeronia sordidicola TaxID=196367 RepID=A0A158GSK1_CABSO|nr:hypothetical protein AWB64_03428 [Caballeronia sordidicola]
MPSIFLTASRARFVTAAVFPVVVMSLGMGVSLAHAAGPSNAGPEAPFLAENDDAMTRMMDAMSIKPSGDVDHDFVGMMLPHHQGAIDMAQAELRYGHNEQLRRIAQEIVVEQQQEIIAMRLALGQPLPPSAPAPDQAQPPSSPASPHAVPPEASSTKTMSMPMSSMRMKQESK